MACKACTTLEGIKNYDVTAAFPQEPVKEGDFYYIDVTVGVWPWPDILTRSVSICIYRFDQLEATEIVSFGPLGGTQTKYFSFKMGGRDATFNVSIMDIGLIDTCEYFKNFTVFRSGVTPVTKKYSCPGVGKTCIEDPNSQDSHAQCIARGCVNGGGIGGECKSDEIDLFGSCQKKSDIFIAVGAGVLLMMMMK